MRIRTGRVSRWLELVSSAARKRLVMALAPAIALLGVVVAPATPVQAAYGCHYSDSGQTVYTLDGWTLYGQEYAGHYSGRTAVPSTTGVSAAGIEAQCLLLEAGFNPGTIDGIFGPNSQRATWYFQRSVDSVGANISVDGLPGPQTWPWLRCRSQTQVRCYGHP
jgi:hypothetical protein